MRVPKSAIWGKLNSLMEQCGLSYLPSFDGESRDTLEVLEVLGPFVDAVCEVLASFFASQNRQVLFGNHIQVQNTFQASFQDANNSLKGEVLKYPSIKTRSTEFLDDRAFFDGLIHELGQSASLAGLGRALKVAWECDIFRSTRRRSSRQTPTSSPSPMSS